MALEIFKLFGSIMVDSSAAEDSIQKTDEKAEKLGNKLQSGIKTAGKWAAGITAGAAAVGGAMFKAAERPQHMRTKLTKCHKNSVCHAKHIRNGTMYCLRQALISAQWQQE